MDLSLTIEEAEELRTALQIRLVEMRTELAHTDDRAYRIALRESLERLEDVERQVEDLLVDPAVAPSP